MGNVKLWMVRVQTYPGTEVGIWESRSEQGEGFPGQVEVGRQVGRQGGGRAWDLSIRIRPHPQVCSALIWAVLSPRIAGTDPRSP